MNRPLFILGISIFYTFCLFSQEKASQKDIVYYRDGSVFIGEIIVDYSPSMRMALVTGDTITLKGALIKRRVDGNDILIYPKGKYHFTSGTYATFGFGFSISDHISSLVNFEIEKMINEKLDVGISFGFQYHRRPLETVNNTFGIWVDSHTIPVLGQARYYLTNTKTRLYGVGKLGYGFATSGGFNNVENLKGGMNFYTGMGLTYATKWNGKFFFEMAQNNQKASGTIFETDFNLLPVELDYDLWFNRVVISYGLRYKL